MKFAIGFVVGAYIGRPVLNAVGRKTNLTEKVQKKTGELLCSASDHILNAITKKWYPNESHLNVWNLREAFDQAWKDPKR